MKGLSDKHGGSDLMRKNWLYMAYNILMRRFNIVDLPEVLCMTFGSLMYVENQTRFIVQDSSHRHEPIPLMMNPPKVYYSFKVIKSYRISNQTSFGLIRRLPQHILDSIPSNSAFKKYHLKMLVLVDLLNPIQIS